jgi:hypothetical protein
MKVERRVQIDERNVIVAWLFPVIRAPPNFLYPSSIASGLILSTIPPQEH